jgi:regulator of protease activity HflC (stomatin/prohibitin superfamily)
MKAIILSIIVSLAAIIGGGVMLAKCTKIDPGHVGVSIKKCDGGGVDKAPIPTGYYWRVLFCEEVDQYPTNLQTLVLANSPHEGKAVDESITASSAEGLPVNLDVSLSFTLDPAKVPTIYTKYRSPIEIIAHTFVRQTIREGIQKIFAQFTAEQLYSTKREESRAQIQAYLTDRLASEGFVIQQFTVNETRVPKQIIDAINAKVAMTQDAQKAEAAVRKTIAEAAQTKAKAEGEASALRTRADAEAYYNKTVAQSITPEYLHYKAQEKWDGKLPQFTGGGPVPFIQVPGNR